MAMTQFARIAVLVLALGAGTAGVVALARQPAGRPAAQARTERTRTPLPLYVVEPPDMLEVEVAGALPERPLTGEHLVRPDGTIGLGYYGQVYVSGLTLPEIKAKVALHLRQFLTDEQLGLAVPDPARPGHTRSVAADQSTRIRVDVTAYNSKCYYVLGAVASPGRFPVTGCETVLDALNYAGGLREEASTARIRLVRPAPPGACCEQILPVKYEAITKTADPATNYQIMPGDRLIVERDPTKPRIERDDAPVRPGTDELRSLDRRISTLEEKLDRVIEMLGGDGALERSKGNR